MKRLTLVYLFICLSVISLAFSPCLCETDPPREQADTTHQQTIDQNDISAVKDTAQVPMQLSGINIEGTVEVSFKIREDGTLNIVNVNANNPELIQYVITKLKNVRLDPAYRDIGRVIKYRFQFNKEA